MQKAGPVLPSRAVQLNLKTLVLTNYVGNFGYNSVVTTFRQILGGLSRHRGRGVHPPREAAALRAPAVDQAGVPGLLPMGRRFVSLLQVRMASLRKAMREKLGRASNRMQNFSGEKDQVNGPKPFSTIHSEFPPVTITEVSG